MVGQTYCRVDGQTEGQTLFIGPFWPCSGVQQEKSQKKVSDQTMLDNFKHCKRYLLEIGMIQGGHDVA